ncbi:cell division protein FtsB [Thiohalobacter thiocyanaticus]|uniref:Cell division protein FtsB n=1 Tax=Thiohalobacter thiocyanaticus TaxID=585455 RepID=A0A426QE53_9GAMM|nr:cell division protein FtsB [Thiohalobacter thiocyanaticus]RRQ20038.1 cell division protein FtsB [Thiohalobacter thiocyanaticus]
MRWLLLILALIFLGLQYKLWVGEGSLAEVWHLRGAVEQQRKENENLRERNRALDAEVRDLKQGLDAVEERARSELGMIRDGETFYQVIEPDKNNASDD